MYMGTTWEAREAISQPASERQLLHHVSGHDSDFNQDAGEYALLCITNAALLRSVTHTMLILAISYRNAMGGENEAITNCRKPSNSVSLHLARKCADGERRRDLFQYRVYWFVGRAGDRKRAYTDKLRRHWAEFELIWRGVWSLLDVVVRGLASSRKGPMGQREWSLPGHIRGWGQDLFDLSSQGRLRKTRQGHVAIRGRYWQVRRHYRWWRIHAHLWASRERGHISIKQHQYRHLQVAVAPNSVD